MSPLDTSRPGVAFKLDILDRAMPATTAAVFGDMHVVEGAFAERCVELGSQEVTVVDTLETPGWIEARRRPGDVTAADLERADPDEREVRALRHNVEQLRRELDSQRAAMAQVLNSRSWKVTAPLRAVIKLGRAARRGRR